MSRVIKNNDGVTVVEGTPAASLVKDSEKFFAAEPPERMAGESIAPVRRDTMLTGKIKDKDGNEIVDRKPTPKELDSFLAEQGIFKLGAEKLGAERLGAERLGVEKLETLREGSKFAEPAMKREEALDKTREFKRQRSSMENQRSQEEKDATRGKFITTLGR
tara:strand:+ start:24 stop:509 length:486 start_codon:yes stop_codon:yes gene_type:complete